ncbi:MAG: A24 family peptidase [Oscillospiraceae bacterium]|nr:A24 family peptidase [Oscillospiraceae bacterium]
MVSVSRENMMRILPYLGLPVPVILLLIMREGRTEPFVLLWHELLIVFGYLAAVLDLKTRRIPNKLIMLMLAVWVMTLVPKLFIDPGTSVEMLIEGALGFMVCGAIFLVVYIFSRNGLGGGDVKFMAVAGLYLGLENSVPAVFIGTVAAAITGIVLIVLKKIQRKDPIPLVPFLYAGILVTLFLR